MKWFPPTILVIVLITTLVLGQKIERHSVQSLEIPITDSLLGKHLSFQAIKINFKIPEDSLDIQLIYAGFKHHLVLEKDTTETVTNALWVAFFPGIISGNYNAESKRVVMLTGWLGYRKYSWTSFLEIDIRLDDGHPDQYLYASLGKDLTKFLTVGLQHEYINRKHFSNNVYGFNIALTKSVAKVAIEHYGDAVRFSFQANF